MRWPHQSTSTCTGILAPTCGRDNCL